MNHITQEQHEKLANVYYSFVLIGICNISFDQFVAIVVPDNNLVLNRSGLDELGLDIRKVIGG